jgi:hypothetical protein
MKKKKPSELFEGKNSSLHQQYEKAVMGDDRRKLYQIGYKDGVLQTKVNKKK